MLRQDTPAATPYEEQARSEHKFLAEVEQIETPAVHRFRQLHVLPWDHNKQIQKQPPGQQQSKIERPCADRMILLPLVRLNRKRPPSWEQRARRE